MSLAELATALPDGTIATDPDVLATYRHDQAGLTAAGTPAAVVHAASTEDVQAVLRWATEHRIAVVTRGAGSGLSGGANAIDHGIVLSLAPMTRILEVDAANQFALVEPGVINADVDRAAAAHGLWFPPDPASRTFSTVGGNVATNAGGLCCLKYGVTGDFVLGLDVVLADGTLLRTGRRTVKGVAGYDLTHLFVGSEGTLGVVTRATLRLRPRPAAPSTLVAFFPTLAAAGLAVRDLVNGPITPSLLEIMDRPTLNAVDDELRMGLDRSAAALLIAQFDQGGSSAVDAAARTCSDAGVTELHHTADLDEGEAFLAARRKAYPALEQLGTTLLDDVAVPRSAIPELIASIEKVAERRGLLIGTFGHAGDGNLHPTIVFDAAVEAQVENARGAFDDVIAATLDLGGTVTGEHGVGALKRDWFAREAGHGSLQAHRAVKHAFDPLGILNPGKVFASAAH